MKTSEFEFFLISTGKSSATGINLRDSGRPGPEKKKVPVITIRVIDRTIRHYGLPSIRCEDEFLMIDIPNPTGSTNRAVAESVYPCHPWEKAAYRGLIDTCQQLLKMVDRRLYEGPSGLDSSEVSNLMKKLDHYDQITAPPTMGELIELYKLLANAIQPTKTGG